MTGYEFLKSSAGVFILASRLTFAFAPQPAFAADLYFFKEEIFADRRSALLGQASISLYRLAGSRLTPVPLNLGPPKFLDFTIADSEMRLLVLGGSYLMPSQVRVMSMDRPGVFMAAEVNVPGWAGNYDEIGLPGGVPLLTVDLVSLDMNESLLGKPDKHMIKKLDSTTGQWEEASPEVYKQLRLTGGIGGFEVDGTGHWYLKRSLEGN